MIIITHTNSSIYIYILVIILIITFYRMQLCELISSHPKEIVTVDVESILRSGIKKFSDEVGNLWTCLADHYVRLGYLSKARDIYEEALESVSTMRDFTLIFEAFSNFEEAHVTAKLAVMGRSLDSEKSEVPSYPSEAGDLPLILKSQTFQSHVLKVREDRKKLEKDELSLMFERLEWLIERRPELQSSVKLRQNPNNVHEWINRARIFAKDTNRMLETFGEAVATIEPMKCTGYLPSLFFKFAKFYESHKAFSKCREVFLRATKIQFRTVEELASIWSGWVEFELRNENFQEALEVSRRSVQRITEAGTAATRIHRSVKLWGLCADLEESFGSLESMCSCYESMFDSKIITPRLVLQYAQALEDRQYFERSFRVYSRGVQIFQWPHLYDIWMTYLSKFISRYAGSQLERTRDLFEEAIKDVPVDFSRRLCLLYAKLEEQYGSDRNAVRVYETAVKNCKPTEKLNLYILLVAKTQDVVSLTKTREIFEQGINDLDNDELVKFSKLFRSLEISLGEIDRARAIFMHTSEYCDPKTSKDFWEEWKDFEINYGTQSSFAELLRQRRMVNTKYNFKPIELKRPEEIEEETLIAAKDPMAAAEAELDV
eukprot:GHVP01048606.1.p1 GENE.GHVP01048606.1~~GHVP01048606.1.p1  ORF type:complete len:603 (-),score=107.11 GHVP01048606.1:55-1863(-)